MASTFSFQSRSRHQVGWVSFGYGCTLLIKDFKGYVINFPVRWINIATFAGTVSIKNTPLFPLGAPWQRSLFLLVRLYIQVSDGPSRYRLFVLIKSHTIKKKNSGRQTLIEISTVLLGNSGGYLNCYIWLIVIIEALVTSPIEDDFETCLTIVECLKESLILLVELTYYIITYHNRAQMIYL